MNDLNPVQDHNHQSPRMLIHLQSEISQGHTKFDKREHERTKSFK